MSTLVSHAKALPAATASLIAGKTATLEGLRFRWQFLVFITACLVIISRRPDAAFHAQFYAEDGRMWFANAYNQGWWRILFHTYEGYFHLLPRLAGAAALLVPVAYAPLVENSIAIAIQALPVCLLVSPRSIGWGSLRFRYALAVLYLLLPNTREIQGTVTESQWILALCALLLLVASPPDNWVGRVADISFLVLCSLTGPFCIFLLPVSLLLLWQRRESWSWIVALIFFFGSAAQGIALLTHESTRHHAVLGANFEWFMRILGGQIYLGTLLGGNQLASRLSLTVLACIATLGCIILALAALISTAGMRAFLLLSVILFAAALAHPVAYPPQGVTAWEILAGGSGSHYMFFLSLAFAWSLAWCFRSKNQLLQIVSTCLLLLMIVGLVRDFRYPAFTDLHFANYARQLDTAQPKSNLTIPEYPEGWDLRLTKR